MKKSVYQVGSRGRSILAPDPDTMPNSILHYRLQLGLSQAQLAYKIGSTNQNIARWEHGKCEIGAITALRLAAALGITVEEMLKKP